AEAAQHAQPSQPRPLREIVALVSWRDRNLAGATQAGLVNNFNDGLVWVVLPVLLADHGLRVDEIGWIKALYPFMWAAGMIATGQLADRIGRKAPIVLGMLTQAVGLAVIAAGLSPALAAGLAGAFLLGVGTALVYPALLAAVTDASHPSWRPSALGVYRFWRDSGYALGALTGGITAAIASLNAAVLLAALITATSGIASATLIRRPPPQTNETNPARGQPPPKQRHPRPKTTEGSANVTTPTRERP
ncbi:MAG: MFS transporter, partial [Candidatus Dormibacteraeota bacterium]|nr:MFS transporter [Candidatus Dormibacteraeota bacterium]